MYSNSALKKRYSYIMSNAAFTLERAVFLPANRSGVPVFNVK